jgi:serine/threonine-protein kinase CHEK2
VSNRHCLIFSESKGGDVVAVLEDLSTNGTYICSSTNPFGEMLGRNKRHELQDGDIVALMRDPQTDLLQARYEFRYPRSRETNGFHQQFTILQQLGKGHFATVFLCLEKSTGMRYAVKKFEKRQGPGEKSRIEGLQQEIAVLQGVSHPSLLCLKETFNEEDGVYLVLELAPEGELFNWIVMKQKLTEAEARKVFVQLFQAVKYLVRLASTAKMSTLSTILIISA